MIQLLQVLDNICASLHNGVLGCQFSIGLDAQFKGCEKRVRDFVGGEEDLGRLDEACAEEVAESVVFLVKSEDCGIGHAYSVLGTMQCKGWIRLTSL